jgi:hypothetical protein
MAITAQKQVNMISRSKSGISNKYMAAKIVNCTGFAGLIIHIYTGREEIFEPG